MKTITVQLKKRSYNILVGSNILSSIAGYLKQLKLGSDAYVISNAYIKNKYAGIIKRSCESRGINVYFKLIADTEKSKSFKTAFSVVKDISNLDKKKKIFIIALGGGVVGDLSGFVASIYRRGIAYVQVPTTLLAQVDSSIGGKTGVDLRQGKNLLGAFYQPRLVFSDVATLKSLDARQLRSGLSEIIKYALILDPQLFVYLEKNYKDILNAKPAALEYVVSRCSAIKAKIVAIDEREEKGSRTILNFGHTIGHALEAAGGYKKYNHGESIAIGMLIAVRISEQLRLIKSQKVIRIERLLSAVGLPLKIKGVQLPGIIKAHYHDKKFSGKKNKFVLLEDIGKARIVQNIPLEVIRDSVKDC